MELIVLLAIGLFAGLIAGLMGVGGGIIFTPVLFFLFEEAGVDNPVLWTIASGLFCTFVAAFGSSVRQFQQNNTFWKEGITLGILGVIGVTLGKMLVTSEYYNQQEFAIFFSLMLIYASAMMFKRGRDKSKEEDREFKNIGFKEGFITGGIGGFVASLAGVGGGGVMVPIMNLIFKQPFRKAVSVSQLAMIIMVFSGWIQYAFITHDYAGISDYTLGYIDFGAALPLSIGGLIGGFGGALLNHKINRKILQWGFSILAFVMASRLIWSVF